MQKILIAVDGSEVSHRAVERVIRMTGLFKEPPELHVLAVHLPLPMAGRVGAVVGKDVIERYQQEEEAEFMKDACATLDAAGLAYTRHTAVGDIAGEIVKAAGQIGADLVCMGTHGRGKIGSMVLGSVAQKVLHLSPVPVLLVR